MQSKLIGKQTSSGFQMEKHSDGWICNPLFVRHRYGGLQTRIVHIEENPKQNWAPSLSIKPEMPWAVGPVLAVGSLRRLRFAAGFGPERGDSGAEDEREPPGAGAMLHVYAGGIW